MSNTLAEIAQQLKDNNKKVQLIYAFNGSGKTRLSREFKDLVAPKQPDADDQDDDQPARSKILYYNAFTEDLFYWDNDLEGDTERKLLIQRNTYTQWVLEEQGQDRNAIGHFQRYTNDKLTPRFNEPYSVKDVDGKERIIPAFSEVTFSFERGDDQQTDNIKISKGEESNFIWSIFYAVLEEVIGVLNVANPGDRETHDFDDLEYIFIDDPVSSLDENHLIQLAIDLAALIKGSNFDPDSKEGIKFIISTHNPLFYNVLFNELNKAKKFMLAKDENGEYDLRTQKNDSPFAYHLFIKEELERAVETGDIKKYHFNFLRNLLEKTSTFVGYEKWGDLLPESNGEQENPYARMINLYSHSKHSSEEITEVKDDHKRTLGFLVRNLDEMYRMKMKAE
ncbi:anticodon nuclease [bacterium]|nr:MAG: anticodon nuclease [bacterium]